MTSRLDTVCRLFAGHSLSMFFCSRHLLCRQRFRGCWKRRFTVNRLRNFQAASAQAEQDRTSFRASLTPSIYESVPIRGTFDPIGRTLIDATIVPQIALAVSEGNGGRGRLAISSGTSDLAVGSPRLRPHPSSSTSTPTATAVSATAQRQQRLLRWRHPNERLYLYLLTSLR